MASGSITESDVLLASASDAIVVGFNSWPTQGAQSLANVEGVDVRFYDIIYNLIDDVEKALEGLLEPVFEDIVEGIAVVRAIFPAGKTAKAAGFYVTDGRIARDTTVHVLRGGKELHVGPITSLKHFKGDVREVAVGLEGGMVLKGFNNFREEDTLQAHRSVRAS